MVPLTEEEINATKKSEINEYQLVSLILITSLTSCSGVKELTIFKKKLRGETQSEQTHTITIRTIEMDYYHK